MGGVSRRSDAGENREKIGSWCLETSHAWKRHMERLEGGQNRKLGSWRLAAHDQVEK